MPPQLPFCIIQPLRIPDIWVVEPTALLVAGHRGWRSCPKSMLMDGEGRVGAADVRLVSVWIWSQWWVWEAERWWLALGVVGRTHIHTHTHKHTHFSPAPDPGNSVSEVLFWSQILLCLNLTSLPYRIPAKLPNLSESHWPHLKIFTMEIKWKRNTPTLSVLWIQCSVQGPCAWTWDGIADVGTESKARIRQGGGSESNRETQRKSYGSRIVIMPELCNRPNRQVFLLTEEAALRDRILATGGKAWRPPARRTEVWVPALVKIILSWHPTVRQILGSLFF